MVNSVGVSVRRGPQYASGFCLWYLRRGARRSLPAMDAMLTMTPPRPPLSLLMCSSARYVPLMTPICGTHSTVRYASQPEGPGFKPSSHPRPHRRKTKDMAVRSTCVRWPPVWVTLALPYLNCIFVTLQKTPRPTDHVDGDGLLPRRLVQDAGVVAHDVDASEGLRGFLQAGWTAEREAVVFNPVQRFKPFSFAAYFEEAK